MVWDGHGMDFGWTGLFQFFKKTVLGRFWDGQKKIILKVDNLGRYGMVWDGHGMDGTVLI
jgi:hypothetical protein